MRRWLGIGALALAVIGAGCVLVTGSTDGYSSPPSPVQCTGSGDCEGGVCCYDYDGGLTSSCQASCLAPEQQACRAAEECGDGGTCKGQTCLLDGGGTLQLATCGAIPYCIQ